MLPTDRTFGDTDPAAEQLQFEIWREISVEQRLRLVGELCDSTRHLAAVGIRLLYPDASDSEVMMRLAETWLDRETMIRCYGWDPREH